MKKKTSNNFVTIDEREIKIDYQLVLSVALCLLRVSQSIIDDFLRKQMREDYHDVNVYQKVVKRFLKKYYWKKQSY